jgi:hypothetical protein
MSAAYKEIRHGIVWPHFATRFASSPTVLSSKSSSCHTLDVPFLTQCLLSIWRALKTVNLVDQESNYKQLHNNVWKRIAIQNTKGWFHERLLTKACSWAFNMMCRIRPTVARSGFAANNQQTMQTALCRINSHVWERKTHNNGLLIGYDIYVIDLSIASLLNQCPPWCSVFLFKRQRLLLNVLQPNPENIVKNLPRNFLERILKILKPILSTSKHSSK